MSHFCRFLYISFSWTLQIPFLIHNTTHGSNIKVTMFICGWCQAICSKLKCHMQEFPLCFPNIPNFWPVVYTQIAWDLCQWGAIFRIIFLSIINACYFLTIMWVFLFGYSYTWRARYSEQDLYIFSMIVSFILCVQVIMLCKRRLVIS